MDENPTGFGEEAYNSQPVYLAKPASEAGSKAPQIPRGQESIVEKTKDYLIYGIAAAVLLVVIILGSSTTHVLPQTSTTFSMQRVDNLTDFMDNYDAEDLDTPANYLMSNFNKIKRLHPVGSHKFSVGCYGPSMLVLDLTASWWDTQSELTRLQLTAGTGSSISVCRCIDEHVEIAFGDTTFQSVEAGAFVPKTLSALVTDYVNRSRTDASQRMSGNVPFLITTQGEFDQLTEIRQWCSKSAAPVYTMHQGAVYNSRLLLFVSLCFVIVGLDLLEVRKFCRECTENSQLNPLWALDLFPLVVFFIMMLQWQFDTNLRKENSKWSFLMTLLYALILILECKN